MKWIWTALLATAILGVWHIGGSHFQSYLAGDVASADDNGNGKNAVEWRSRHRSGDRMNRMATQQDEASDSVDLADAYAAIRSQGDYGALRAVMGNKSPNERFSMIYGEFMGLRSRLGSGHDFQAKLAIINEFGGDRVADLKQKLLKATGRSLSLDGDREFIASLDNESWRTMVSGAAERNSSKAFEFALADLEDGKQGIACAEVTRVWLGFDSVAASKRVVELPKGALKDVAICEMVRWLVHKGSVDEASAWIAEISDNGLRENLVALAVGEQP